MAKTNTSTGTGTGSSGSGSSSGSRGSGFYSGSEPITVNTEALRRAGLEYRGVGDGFRRFAQHHERLAVYEPLVNGESDETWDEFSPGYKKGARKFAEGLHNLARAAYAIADGVAQMAGGYERTEENAIELGRNALFLQGPPPGYSGGNGQKGAENARVVVRSVKPDQPAEPEMAVAARVANPIVSPSVMKFVDSQGNPADPDFGMPLVPQVLTNAEGEPIGILAPAGTSLQDNGKRTVFVGKDGKEKGFFQPFGDHTFDEAQRDVARPMLKVRPMDSDGDGPAESQYRTTLAARQGEGQPVTTVVKFVDSQENPVDPDIAIPLVPQVLTNAEGEEIGILAPAGTPLEDNGNRTVFVGSDGAEKGFFQPFGDHTFDEAQLAELQPARQGVPVTAEIGIPEVPQILTNAEGEEIGLLAPAGTPFQETENRVVFRDEQGREIGFFQPFGDHTFDEAQTGVARRRMLTSMPD